MVTINKTISLYSQNRQLKGQIAFTSNASGEFKELEQKSKMLEFAINKYLADSSRGQEYLFEVIGSFCASNNLVIKEVPKTETQAESEFNIVTSRITIEGGFISLLKLLFYLEHQTDAGRVSSANFSVQKNNKRKRDVLLMTIYIQHMKITNEKL